MEPWLVSPRDYSAKYISLVSDVEPTSSVVLWPYHARPLLLDGKRMTITVNAIIPGLDPV